ncbi:MAG: tetratricopeptide repeat protein [Lysobacterales bacterium]
MDSDLLQGFYLNDVRVEPLKGEVRHGGQSVHLPPKAMEVLLCLASNPSKLVTRETLIERVWGPGQGSPELLGRAVSEIRHALGDSSGRPRFIQTLPRRGYRLIALPQPAAAALTATPQLEALSLFDNLRQRGVLETAIAYLVFGWLIIQVADIVFDQLHLPDWGGTFVTVLVIAGFPIALALSWYLEFRDGRAVLDNRSPKDARRRQFSRTYLSVIGALAIAAAGVFLYDHQVGLPRAEPATPEPQLAQVVPPPVRENSIAVLPFLNLDGSSETAIFAHGLADDVIDRLARVPGLLVSSRGDSYTLEPNSTSSRVRERLRVSRYLEGSVQMAGDRIRIIIQLIDSETGFHVLSRRFDRPREDFFDIRDEITELTVANVRVALPPGTRLAPGGLTDDPSLDVYVLYRRGVEAALLPRSVDSLQSALGWYEAALTIDPDYAAAHAGKCQAYVQLYPVTDNTSHIASAEASCARALELNSNLDVVHTALGDLYAATGKYAEAEQAFLAALEVDPNSVASLIGLGGIYTLQRKPEEAERRFEQAIGLNPGDWSAYNALGYFYYRSGRYDDATRQYEHVLALDPDNMLVLSNLAAAHMLDGDFEAALPALQRVLEISPRKSAYTNLGMMYYYLNRPEDAIGAQRKAVELAPNDHLVWSNLGDALWMAGASEEAREAFATAERLVVAALGVNPNDPASLMDLAWIAAMLEQPAKARSLIGRALELAPDDPYAHYYAGLIRLRAGETDAALSAFEAALERGYPVNMLAHDPQLSAILDDRRFRGMVEREKAE